MKKCLLSIVIGLLFALLVTATASAQGWSVTLWYGDVAELESGWQLCDGSNGTPDLRNLFVVGAGSDYGLGDAGGAITVSLAHRHQVEAHQHTITPTTTVVESWTPAQPMTVVQTLSETGYESPMSDYQLTGDTENRPPYIGVYYVCYSGTLAVSAVISDPMVTNYYTTTEGTVYAKSRTITSGEEVTNYLLIAILALGVLQLAFHVVEGKRKWS